MNQDPSTQHHQIYPKRYFALSQTWFAWNRITVADVYTLREESGFEGQGIYFWLNYPIRYVRLVGIVVQIELVAAGRFTLLTLDDSSGANIEVKIPIRQTSTDDTTEYPSNTLVDNVNVVVRLGVPNVYVNESRLCPGAVIMVKGTIAKFNNQRQLSLARIFLVKETHAEAVLWAQAAEWKRTRLAQPWVLTEKEREQFHQKELIEEQETKERKKRRRKRLARAAKREAKDDAKRSDLEKTLNKGALTGSDLIPDYRAK